MLRSSNSSALGAREGHEDREGGKFGWRRDGKGKTRPEGRKMDQGSARSGKI